MDVPQIAYCWIRTRTQAQWQLCRTRHQLFKISDQQIAPGNHRPRTERVPRILPWRAGCQSVKATVIKEVNATFSPVRASINTAPACNDAGHASSSQATGPPLVGRPPWRAPFGAGISPQKNCVELLEQSGPSSSGICRRKAWRVFSDEFVEAGRVHHPVTISSKSNSDSSLTCCSRESSEGIRNSATRAPWLSMAM